MDLATYINILWRRKWIILVIGVVTVALVTAATINMPRTYTAKTILRVATTVGRDVEYGDYVYMPKFVNTLSRIVQSRPVKQQVQEEIGLAGEFEVSVDYPGESELMFIIVDSEDPVLSAQIANGLTQMAVETAREIRRSNLVTVIEPAIVPPEPSSPNLKLNIALAIIAGMVGGIGIAFLLENLDTTLHESRQIAEVTAVDLASLVKIPPAKAGETAIWMNGESLQGEAFRRLRTMLQHGQNGSMPRVLMVTSAQPQEGKSTVVSNLAFTLAQSGKKVIVVDGDLRVPTIHTIFHVSNEAGLSDILHQRMEISSALQHDTVTGITLLTSGIVDHLPTEMLGSEDMHALLKHLSTIADFVLLDTPSFLAITDAALLAPHVDGVLLVVGRARAQSDAVQSVLSQLSLLQVPVVGVVVNHAELDNGSQYYNYYRRHTSSVRK